MELELKNINEILAEGEYILWKGKPDGKSYIGRYIIIPIIQLSAIMVPLILLLRLALSLASSQGASDIDNIILIIMTAFIVSYVSMLSIVLITRFLLYKKICYIVTDRRILFFSNIIPIEWPYYRDIHYRDISFRDDYKGFSIDKNKKSRIGSIIFNGDFGAKLVFRGRYSYYVPVIVGFQSINHPDGVADIINTAYEKIQKDEPKNADDPGICSDADSVTDKADDTRIAAIFRDEDEKYI